MLATHSAKLERWLGLEECERMSAAMKDWYGPPIAVGNVPGVVYACKGGDFRGRIRAGQMSPLIDYYEQRLKRLMRRVGRGQLYSMNAGFASMSDLISEATVGGKSRRFYWYKTGFAATGFGSTSIWQGVGAPTAGVNAANAPGGEAPTSATVGAHPFTNPTGGDTQHFVGSRIVSNVSSLTPLLYDRIFMVNKTMNSNATEAVTGVPTRYQSSTPSNADYAGGNFVFPEVGATALASGAHNWNACLYRNQAGTDNQTFPIAVGLSGAGARKIDLAVPGWFLPLAAGDIGVMDLAQMQYDTSAIATGVLNFVIGHPIAFMPVIGANELFKEDGIMTAFNLTRIFDDAALAIMVIYHAAGTAPVITAVVDTVSG